MESTGASFSADVYTIRAEITYTPAGAQGFQLLNSTIAASPFYTNISNPNTTSLTKDTSALAIFWVNATGSVNAQRDFYVTSNRTSDMTVSNQSSGWNVTIEGASTLDLNVSYPFGNINATQNIFFNITANVTCRVSDCGEINVSLWNNYSAAGSPTTGYVDPDGDVATGWTDSTRTEHYDSVDDGIRQANEPNLTDYIYEIFDYQWSR